MIQLAYTSIAVKPMNNFELVQLLQQSRVFNDEHNITGILLYKEQSFFQVIEGDKDIVNKLLLSILDDTRHFDVGVLFNRHIEERDFDNWSMGFVNLEDEEYDLESWQKGSFKFPLQQMSGNLTQLVNIRTASNLVKSFSQRL